nr:uncharacterized protein LOC100449110 [Pongo abelii]
MAEAVVGDDDYGEDRRAGRGSWRRQRSAVQLQEMAVELLGLGRTLFVPSNTMANLISVMCHCRRRGSQLLLGQECHLHVYEQGGAAQMHRTEERLQGPGLGGADTGLRSGSLLQRSPPLRQEVPLDPSALIPFLTHRWLECTPTPSRAASLHPGLAELERMITRGLQSPYHQVCELICLENSHSISGVPVLPIDYLRQVHLLAQTYGPPVHLDGAQLMNVALALHVPPTHIVEHCDSVSFCLSKVRKPWAGLPQTGGVGRPSGRQGWIPELHPWQLAPGSPLTSLQTGLRICPHPGPRTGM